MDIEIVEHTRMVHIITGVKGVLSLSGCKILILKSLWNNFIVLGPLRVIWEVVTFGYATKKSHANRNFN